MNRIFTYQKTQDQNQVSRLTDLEKAHPENVLEDFFDFATVTEARACLGEWLLASLHARDGAQFNYIHLWQQLERLIEANWLMFQDQKHK